MSAIIFIIDLSNDYLMIKKIIVSVPEPQVSSSNHFFHPATSQNPNTLHAFMTNKQQIFTCQKPNSAHFGLNND